MAHTARDIRSWAAVAWVSQGALACHHRCCVLLGTAICMHAMQLAAPVVSKSVHTKAAHTQHDPAMCMHAYHGDADCDCTVDSAVDDMDFSDRCGAAVVPRVGGGGARPNWGWAGAVPRLRGATSCFGWGGLRLAVRRARCRADDIRLWQPAPDRQAVQ